MLIIVYLFVCCVVGFAGRMRPFGFAGYVLLSLFLTPVVPLIFLLLTQRRFIESQTAKTSSITVCRNCAGTKTGASAYCMRCGAPL